MEYFTADNTEGFTSDELKTLNDAFEEIQSNCDADASNIGDRINDAYIPGITKADLVQKAGF